MRRVVEIKGWNHAEEDLAPVEVLGRPAVRLVAPRPPPRWPTTRVAAVEALWGEGFAAPGGGTETLRLVRPMALSSAMTVLLLGGGLGGPASTICSSSGAWVASFEADPELCAQASARCPPSDRGAARISVAVWDRNSPGFRPRTANHALLLEALRGTRPAPLLESLAAALAPDSQIVLTELVCDDPPSERDREFAAWCRLDDRLPELPRTQEVTGALQRLGYDVRLTEDMSDRHITQTLGGWREAVRAMGAGPRPTAHTASAFVTEAELWLLRIRLMRRLGVKLMRWHAVRSSG